MLKWALIFAVKSLAARILGFTGLAAGAATIGKFPFGVFLALFLIFLLLGVVVYHKSMDD